ncbi:MAG: sortase [Candidatus Berkelbacteria bacterium]|nr:sortase [Candidatus Berkelbacteria bacterium]
MKIEEEDLIRLFDNEDQGLSPNNKWEKFEEEPKKHLKMKRVGHITDKAEIRNIRKVIKKIPERRPKKKGGGTAQVFLKTTMYAGFTGFAIFLSLNFPAYKDQIKWSYYADYLGKTLPKTEKTVTAEPKPSAQTSIETVSVPEELPVVQQPTPKPTPAPVLPDKPEGNFIKIERIGVDAPIVWEVEESQIIQKLLEGVVHYKGTSLPGEGGNIFLVGHSSNYYWARSEYNHVFSLLNKLMSGDRIELHRGRTSYFYQVVETKVVSPKDVSVLSSLNKETLTLMTCWPLGTNLKRLIVQAEFNHAE